MSSHRGVRRVEITERETPVFGGAQFGAVGAYERLHGTVFGALDPEDSGLETARKLRGSYPDVDITIVEGGEVIGLNRKVCNLASMLPYAKHPKRRGPLPGFCMINGSLDCNNFIRINCRTMKRSKMHCSIGPLLYREEPGER